MMPRAPRRRRRRDVDAWLSGWTIFYWAWWISWTPFVGMFIARISRGRTIRQFVTGVLLVPSVVSLLWFAIFGGAAIDLQQDAAAVDLARRRGQPRRAQLFNLLDADAGWRPSASCWSWSWSAIFFVTGADSASIVMGSICPNGVRGAPPADRHLLGRR